MVQRAIYILLMFNYDRDRLSRDAPFLNEVGLCLFSKLDVIFRRVSETTRNTLRVYATK